MCGGGGACAVGGACMRVCLCVCACMRVCIFAYLCLYFTERVWGGVGVCEVSAGMLVYVSECICQVYMSSECIRQVSVYVK